jgi:DNA-binding CsgD family transcriptional regulator
MGHYFMRIYRDQLGYSRAADEELSRLTPREWDCLRTLAQGYREAEIADVLGILKSTVRFHLNNVVRKFGCKNRTQAIALAAQLGVLGPIGP